MDQSVFGDDWYKSYVLFRKNPKGFLEQRKVSKEIFCMDLLKDLFSDEIDVQCKYHLLLTLEQQASFLIQDENMLQQIFGSLKMIYFSAEKFEEQKVLKNQIFMTLTSILLCWKNLAYENENVCSLIEDLRFFLLEIIVFETTSNVLRSSACQCLTKIETISPFIAKCDLDSLSAACQGNEPMPIQHYAVLLSRCLKKKSEHPPRRISDVFIEKEVMKARKRNQVGYRDETEVKVQHVVKCLLDAIPQMPSSTGYVVFQNVIDLVVSAPELLPGVFKPFLQKIIVCFENLYFFVAFDLLRDFGAGLFTSQEEKQFLYNILMSIKKPLINIPQRVPYMDWSETCQVFTNSVTNRDSALRILMAGHHDEVYSEEKKLCLLAMCFQSRQNTVSCSEFLMSCLAALESHASESLGSKTPVSFLRSLYRLFSMFDVMSMHSQIQRFILEVAVSTPPLSLFVLDFIKHVKVECKESDFGDNMLTTLVGHMMNIPEKQFAAKLESYLPILEVAALEMPTTCKPQVMLRQLRKVLLDSSILEVNSWILGHSILSVCSAFMKSVDTEILYHDLGELLHLLMKNVKDVDCQDRAKRYYAALTALSQARVQGLFKTPSYERDGSSSLATFVTGSDTAFHSRHVSVLPKPIFHLIRQTEKCRSIPTKFVINEEHKNGLKASYLEFINSESFKPYLEIPFILKHVEDTDEKYSTIYSIVISVQTDPPCSNSSDIEVPVLKKSEGTSYEGTQVSVKLCPKSSRPVVLNFKAQFSCGDGSSCSFVLPSVTLHLEELFSCLPVSIREGLLELTWKKQLFNELWEEFKLDENNGCLSVYRLEHIKNLSILVECHWKPFLMDRNEDGSAFSVGIFLPPYSHILLKVEIQNESAFVTILADNRKILPFICLYMNQLGSNNKVREI